MRFKGRKVSPEALREVRPARGHLYIWRYLDRMRQVYVPVAALSVTAFPGSPQLLPRLDNVRLTQWKERGLVLTGMEQIEYRKEHHEYPQAWWVRIVMEEPRGVHGKSKGDR